MKNDISSIEQGVYDVLNTLNIPFIRHEHIPIFTVEESNQLNIDIPGQHCKNLFIRNKKGDVHYLLILLDHKRADLKSIAKQIGSSTLSLASEERLQNYLTLRPGSVTAFGLINDKEREVQVLLDNGMNRTECINFHPNVNTATLSISYEGMEKFLAWCGNKVEYVQIE